MRVSRATGSDGRTVNDEEEPPSPRTDELLAAVGGSVSLLPALGGSGSRHDPPAYPGVAVRGRSVADEATSPVPHLLVEFPGRDAAAAPSLKVEAVAARVVRHVSPKPPLEGTATKAFRKKFFRGVSDREWNDWRWQTRNRFRTLAHLDGALTLSPEEREALEKKGTMLPLAITPYYMSLLDPDDPLQPLRKTVVPSSAEFVRAPGEADDPLGEDGHSPVPGLVHRYPDRVLLLAHDFCSTYCRYCTRSRVVGHHEIMPNEARLEQAFEYLRRTPAVRDVLLSGGDPLALSDDRLDWILSKLRAIEHIEFVRIGTKMPAVLPQRITPQLCRVLRRHHPLWMSVHFLHPVECTPEATRACARLADAGIPLGCQTVLLKGVNDSVDVMKDLTHRLLRMRVRPYYLYQCDPISGSSHFRTSIEKGLEIIEGMRGHTTGYACPTYVVDAPGGGGKIPLLPNYVVGREGDDLLLRNFEGKTFRYRDPVNDAVGDTDQLPVEMPEPVFSFPVL